MQLVSLILSFLPVLQLASTQYEDCPPNEIFTANVNPCNNCEMRGSCPQEESGCDCASGLTRNSLGACVPAQACYQQPPNPRSYAPPVLVRCKGPLEEFFSCGTSCPPTCENKPRACPLQCVSGCFCVDGYVRSRQGECVRPDQCQLIPGPPTRPRCGPNEEYTDCGTNCPATCFDRAPLCDFFCVPGCFCRRGFVRLRGRCLHPQECPVPRPPSTCGPNEIYTDCSSACPPTCENRQPVCTAQCIRGCACKAGYLKKNALCVLPQECAPYRLPQPPPALPPSTQVCPDRRKCISTCKRSGSATGFCVGESFKNCACRGR